MSTPFRDVNRTVRVGDVVISLSDVYDRLKGKLDAGTLDQVLRDIVSGGRDRVRPGELITADLINQMLAQLETLETRVAKLESGTSTGGGTGETGALGFIETAYVDSPRGIKLVPTDPNPFPQNFTVTNQTNMALPIQLTAAVASPHGDWSNSIDIKGPSGPVAAGATANFTVNIKTPANAQVGDTAVLKIDATVGPPHNKLSRRELSLTVASSSGPPVTRSVTITPVQQPPNSDSVAVSSILTYALDLKFAATQAPFATPFKVSATLAPTPADTLAEWFFDFSNLTTTNQAPGVITTGLTLDSNATAPARVNVRVRTPAQKSTTVDKTATITIQVESTDPQITPPVSATGGPFNLRLRRVGT